MKNRPVVLLGAGASIDSGLYSAFGLTKAIYGILRSDHYEIPARVFGYIIAKVLLRKVKLGGTPYDDVNVEEAYDAIFRLANRDQDIVSEFVSGWDPFLAAMSPSFNASSFLQHMSRSLKVNTRNLGSGPSVAFDNHELRQAAEEIAKGNSDSASSTIASVLTYLIRALLKCLQHDVSKIGYMDTLMTFVVERDGTVASLNYDLVVEDSLQRIGRFMIMV